MRGTPGVAGQGVRIKVTAEQVASTLRLRSEGRKVAAIARGTGLSRPTIYRILGERCNASTGSNDSKPSGRISCKGASSTSAI